MVLLPVWHGMDKRPAKLLQVDWTEWYDIGIKPEYDTPFSCNAMPSLCSYMYIHLELFTQYLLLFNDCPTKPPSFVEP